MLADLFPLRRTQYMSPKASNKAPVKAANVSSKKVAAGASNNEPVRHFAGYPATVVFAETGREETNGAREGRSGAVALGRLRRGARAGTGRLGQGVHAPRARGVGAQERDPEGPSA